MGKEGQPQQIPMPESIIHRLPPVDSVQLAKDAGQRVAQKRRELGLGTSAEHRSNPWDMISSRVDI